MNDKVLLAVLRERQSAKGTRYLSGWLGKARLIAFQDKDAPEGEVHWQVFAQTPEERDGQAQAPRQRQPRELRAPRAPRGHRADHHQPMPTGELDDPLPW